MRQCACLGMQTSKSISLNQSTCACGEYCAQTWIYTVDKLQVYALKSVLKEMWTSCCRPHRLMIVAWTLCLKTHIGTWLTSNINVWINQKQTKKNPNTLLNVQNGIFYFVVFPYSVEICRQSTTCRADGCLVLCIRGSVLWDDRGNWRQSHFTKRRQIPKAWRWGGDAFALKNKYLRTSPVALKLKECWENRDVKDKRAFIRLKPDLLEVMKHCVQVALDWKKKGQCQHVFKGAICKNWPPVEFLLKTNREQHITRLSAANCSSVSRAVSYLDWGLRAPVGVCTVRTEGLDREGPGLAV